MNGILVVDKPAGWTSHDVAAKLRGLTKTKRVGHSGTLDPMATGVLPVFFGRATRAIEFCEADSKEYLAQLRPGIVTDTQDITGTALRVTDVNITERALLDILPRFTGKISQIPPMYSAVKLGGVPMYKLARRGIEARREAREIMIYALECLGRTPDGDFSLRVECSKGAYIRTLCHDIGAALGCGAALKALRRTRAGRFKIDSALTMEEIIGMGGTIGAVLLPLDRLFGELPGYTADAPGESKCRNGAAFPADVSDGQYRVYSRTGEFLMLGEAVSGVMRTVKSFFEV